MAPAAAPIRAWEDNDRTRGTPAGALRTRGDVIRRVPAMTGVLAIDDEIRVMLAERLGEHARRAERRVPRSP